MRRGFSVLGVLIVSLTVSALSAPAASASLEVFYSEIGKLKLSVDASGTNSETGTIEVDKPTGATVRKAFLFAASTGSTNFNPSDGEVSIDGTPINWDPSHTIPSSIVSFNTAADVTSIVSPKIDAESAGRIPFTIEEENTTLMDGEILAVVFDDPTARSNTITLMYGAQQTLGDHFAIGLSEPLKPSSTAIMGLGISYGYQPAGQYSTVDVNGTRVTSSAGGQDDCPERYASEPAFTACGNGSLITVGGVGDGLKVPDDPFVTDTQCSVDPELAARCDDELYNLKPFTQQNATSIDVDTFNPSNDDNIFFASLDLGAETALVGEGIVLGPTGIRTQAGTFHFLSALAQDEHGDPEVGRTVHLQVISGPNSGLELSSVTNSAGKASFNYFSTQTGTDILEASFTDGSNVTHTSNDVTKKWTPRIPHTFGGEWPYDSSSLPLNYSYSGSHRYLGNVIQGAQNWNASGTKVHISQWTGLPDALDIPFVDVYLPDTWWGMTIFAEGDCSSCGYTRNAIAMNQRTLDPETDAQRTKVATHELGHALGLEHPYGVSTSVPSVMWQGLLGGRIRQTPQHFDTERIDGMYP